MQVNRDTQKFAMKASAVCINGEWIPIAKDPVTDPGKKSKTGAVTLWRSGSKWVSSVERPTGWSDRGIGGFQEVLQTVYVDGKLVKEMTFAEVRANSKL
jgi:nicotinamide phosphoribosyltransferase